MLISLSSDVSHRTIGASHENPLPAISADKLPGKLKEVIKRVKSKLSRVLQLYC